MRHVLLLGASGSIGSQSLDILKEDRANFELVAFSLGKRIERIPEILKDFPSVKSICVRYEEDKLKLEKEYPNIQFYFGDEGLKEICHLPTYDMAVNALVGFSGLLPSITVLNENRILCLANKESLVVGGALIEKILKEGKGKMFPIDSEHVAIAKMLSRTKREDIDKILITASGGSFRNLSREELKSVTPEMALNHPTWSMGAKITIDSATMMNKGFEIIEAKWLFDWPLDRIKVLIHQESNVHSLLLLKDGSYVADISKPDMHWPIKYALYETKLDFKLFYEKDLRDFGSFHFKKFDPERYPAVGIALGAQKIGGTATAILNGANEEAVYAFLAGKIPFLSIERLVSSALEHIQIIQNPSLRDILSADSYARIYVKKKVEELSCR